MKSLFHFFKKSRKIKTPAIDELFKDDFFNDINYPIMINISIFVIYRDAISKFYALNFSMLDMEADSYEDPILKLIATHIKDRMYAENYSYLYHLQNLNQHETVRFVDLSIDDMFQKVCAKVIYNQKDLKEYLELLLFGPAEPFIENIEDLDKV